MARTISAILLVIFSARAEATTPAEATISWDGCYQLYSTGGLYPTVCLDGSSEEGISGFDSRLAVFVTGTDQLAGCGRSSSLVVTQDSLEFIAGGSSLLVLSEAVVTSGALEGVALIDSRRRRLQFRKLKEDISTRLIPKLYLEPKCRNLGEGKYVNL